MTPEQRPCPWCGSDKVHMLPMYGGRGTGQSTAYAGECEGCGYRVEDLPGNGNGRKDTAIREWNRIVKEKQP